MIRRKGENIWREKRWRGERVFWGWRCGGALWVRCTLEVGSSINPYLRNKKRGNRLDDSNSSKTAEHRDITGIMMSTCKTTRVKTTFIIHYSISISAARGIWE